MIISQMIAIIMKENTLKIHSINTLFNHLKYKGCSKTKHASDNS